MRHDASRALSALFVVLLVSGLAGVAECAIPVAQHVHVSTARDTDVIITLDPIDEDLDTLTTKITALPDVGDLYHLADNYINFGYEPARGTQISAVPATLAAGAAHRVVYAAPTAFAATRFEYTAEDATDTSNTGIVDVTKSDNVTVSSEFHFDRDDWQVITAAANDASWSGTSTGSLNHFIYRGEISMVLGADNSQRWYFLAPAKFYRNNARLYGGTLSFWVGSFEGDFETNTYPNPKNFVTLECSTCDSGNGITLAQREVTYTGGLQQMSFTLNELPSSGWRIDPKDDTQTSWSVATTCEFVEVLSGLSGMRIYGDFTTDHEVVGIDSVAFTIAYPASTIPTECY